MCGGWKYLILQGENVYRTSARECSPRSLGGFAGVRNAPPGALRAGKSYKAHCIVVLVNLHECSEDIRFLQIYF